MSLEPEILHMYSAVLIEAPATTGSDAHVSQPDVPVAEAVTAAESAVALSRCCPGAMPWLKHQKRLSGHA
jgi:hypothetical protein